MKTTGSVQEKNGRFYFVINLYDANGKRKIKWISTGLTVRGNKRKAESMLREVLLHYDETGDAHRPGRCLRESRHPDSKTYPCAGQTGQQVGDAVSGLSQ